MTARPSVRRLLLELEDDELRAELFREDGAADGRAGNGRRPDGHRIAVADEQHAVEGDGGAGLLHQSLDDELRARLDAILLSAGRDDGVHALSWD